jgi:hypothetical protein
VIDVADALDRQFQRVGRDLREHGLDALPETTSRRKSGRAVALQHHAHVLARARAAALEIATRRCRGSALR